MPLGLETLGRAVMRRARRGLYAGRHINFGNKVSEDGGNKSQQPWKPNVKRTRLYSHILDSLVRIRVTTHAIRDRMSQSQVTSHSPELPLPAACSLSRLCRSRRSWKPNVQYKRLYSQILDSLVRIRVTTHAIRCIDKAGGLDEYLLQTPDDVLNSDIGVQWKRVIERVRDQRRAQGLTSAAPSPPPLSETAEVDK